MSSENPQFDILLGGVEELPQDLTLMRYASNRAQEILSLTEVLQEPRKTGLVFQRLPRHMRRRVMSHNAKRMPRQLREAHISQMEKSGIPPKSKRPSRKYRRRPSNLLDAYNRRQKENIWLETHIWHAKRFHMTNKWGYRLANFPNDKSKRACYRAAANHCLIQDISYYKCIELKGTYDCIISGLKLLTRDECGRTFCAKTWLNGSREGSVTVFHSDTTYPFGAIGQVLFLWKPEVTTTMESSQDSSQGMELEISVLEKERTIWLWVHPSYYKEVKEELMKVFDVDLSSTISFHMDDSSGTKSKLGNLNSKSELKQAQTNLEVPAIKESDSGSFSHPGPHYEGKGVKITLLEDNLVRLRLTGPLSQATLRESFVLASVKHENGEDTSWMTKWKDIFNCQQEIWEIMSRYTSPAMISPNMVIGLVILDPRCNLPGKRTKAVDYEASKLGLTQGNLPIEVSASPLWDTKIREYATNSKLKDTEINQRQSAKLVPGLLEHDEDSISEKDGIHTRVPILLIQRPGSQDSKNKRLGYCCGWDVIAPAGWGKPLWMALVLRGARAGGLREIEMVEDVGFSHSLCWPPLPDTNAAKIEAKLQEENEREKYFRLPPNKRPNYVKLGISSPFSHQWDILCHEWSNFTPPVSKENTYYVLRDNNKLRKISEILDAMKAKRMSKIGKLNHNEECKYPEEFFNKLITAIDDKSDHGLIPVRVTVSKKGTVNNFAIICIPNKNDFSIDSKGFTQIKEVEEPSNEDENENVRKKIKKEHKQTLAKLRRKRVKQRKESENCAKQKMSEESVFERPVMGPAATSELCQEHKRKVEELVSPVCTQVRKSCSREVAGYVTNGCFSFCDAKEIGTAFVTLPALQFLANTKMWNPQLLVLIRNRHSNHYISAEIEIIYN